MNTTRTFNAFSRPPSSILFHPRYVGTSKTTKASVVVSVAASSTESTVGTVLQTAIPQQVENLDDVAKTQAQPPLAKLSFSTILRSLFILSVSSSPILREPCIYTLSALANPKTALTNVERNPVLHWLVKRTIYKQFNAGENKVEVQRSISEIKNLGFRGVLLGYARELLVEEDRMNKHDEVLARHEVDAWLEGTLQGIEMATEGDFVALKYVAFLPLTS